MDDGLARELELFAAALRLPTIGITQAGEVELLRSLVERYPTEAKRLVSEFYGWKPGDSAAPG